MYSYSLDSTSGIVGGKTRVQTKRQEIWARYGEEIPYCKGGEILGQVAQGSCVCPNHGGVQSQGG